MEAHILGHHRRAVLRAAQLPLPRPPPVPAVNTAVNIPYPAQTANYHYEIELVEVAIGKDGKDIAVEDAANYIFGYAVGLDMTRRDLQMAMREKAAHGKLEKHLIFQRLLVQFIQFQRLEKLIKLIFL